MSPIDCVVFDLGNVLIRWDPRLLYRQLLPDDVAVEAFLAEVDFPAFNHRLDAAELSWDAAIAEMAERHPHRSALLAAYRERFRDSLGGVIEGTVEIVRELHDQGVRLLALTNWSHETFELARDEMPFLKFFEGVVVSGVEQVAKPDPRIFHLLIDRYALDPARTVFVDDNPPNVAAAAAVGLRAVQFREPDALRADLVRLGVTR